MAPTWSDLVRTSADRIGDTLAARRVVEEAAGVGAAELVLVGDAPARPDVLDHVCSMLARLEAGEPLQHVLGHWSFRTVELAVDGRALVPRPETEVVAGHALRELARVRSSRPGPPATGPSSPLVALELGTGSGAIACALVAEDADAVVVAVERSAEALELARENRARLPRQEAARLVVAPGDWYDGVAALLVRHGLGEVVDCIVANPPYIGEHEWAGLDPVVRDHDPYEALVSGPTGLEAVEIVVAGAPALLRPGGALVVEIAPSQADSALAL
ncbi:MAG: N5-glutamine methyltransferase family protein, partial [Acidimicrobiales bacterium]